jgi:hypothetical protein
VMLYNIGYLKNLLDNFFPRYSAIGREVFQCSHYYGNILRIGDTGLVSFLLIYGQCLMRLTLSNLLYKCV